jgi:ribonuclease HI
MPAPSIAEILRHIAREEPLPSTVRAFRGLTREHLGQLIEEAAARLEGGTASLPTSRSEASPESAAPDDASREPGPASGPAPEEALSGGSEGRARRASKRAR